MSENSDVKTILEQELIEQKRCKNIKNKMEEVIVRNYKKKDIKDIQPYKDAIYAGLVDYAVLDIAEDEQILFNFVDTYYDILKSDKVDIYGYVYIQSLLRNNDSFITGVILNDYEISKGFVIEESRMLGGITGDTQADLEAINAVIQRRIDEYVENYDDGAITPLGEMLYIQNNTNLDVNPFVQVDVKKMTKKPRNNKRQNKNNQQ